MDSVLLDFFTLKHMEDFHEEENFHEEEVGIIKEDLTEKKIFVCFEVDKIQKFFEAREYQLPIIKKICDSKSKDISYQEFTPYGIIQARGFKFILNNSQENERIPVIGYVNDRNEKIYVISMVLHENKTVSHFEKIENSEEYILFDKKGNKIEVWPLLI
jgi:hypothetical protein